MVLHVLVLCKMETEPAWHAHRDALRQKTDMLTHTMWRDVSITMVIVH